MVICALIFCLANEAYFDVPIPVSGLVKSFYAHRYLDDHSPWLWPVYVCGAALKTLFSAPQWLLAGFAPEGVQSLVLGLAIALVASPLLRRIAAPGVVDDSSVDSGLTKVCAVLLIAVSLHMLTLSASIMHFSVSAWYHSWLLVSWILWLSWAVERWSRSPVPPAAVRHALITGIVVTLVVVQITSITRQLQGAKTQDLHVVRKEVAEWINANLPTETRLGAWNAGILAYFTDRAVVNLDGLMNSAEYARQLKSGDSTRTAIATLGVKVIVDYNDSDSTMLRNWDQSKSFRGIWDWDEVSSLHHRDAGGGKDLYVVRLRDSIADVGDDNGP